MADSTSMNFAQTYQDAKGHGQAFLAKTIGGHPGTAAIVMALMLILVIVLIGTVMHYKAKCKDGFHIAPISNMTTGNNNPEWWHGSMDAGNWGPVHREATDWNVAAYHPGWRAGRYRRADMPMQKEGLMPSHGALPSHGAACGPGETPVSYANPDGSTVTYCRNTDALPGPPTVCGAGWDPAASAEAEALATVGSLQHEPYGERRLGRAVNAAYDANLGLSDEQLASLMHQGGTP